MKGLINTPPMTHDNVQALPLGTQLGDFRLDAVIGHGSFGITYRAFDSQLAKMVAIKEYLPVECAVRKADKDVVPRGARYADDFAWGRERFLDEARALARFRHPHIVPVLRYFEANGTAYTVMEFEDGRNVAELLREPGGRLAPDDVRRLAAGLLSGLAAVHAQGFLHRDIKPSNIIIRRDGVPILIDFGAARRAMGDRTRTLTGVLTPQYAPIEQYAFDGKQGPWSDIYSAAAVLYHAITGRTPPEAASRVGHDPYRPLAESEAGRLDPAFLAAVDRGLAFAAPDRPQSVSEWRALFGNSLPSAQDAPTQRMEPAAAPRLGGVQREQRDFTPPLSEPRPRPAAGRRWLPVLAVVAAGGAAALWYLSPDVRSIITPKPSGTTTASSSSATDNLPPPLISAPPASGSSDSAQGGTGPTALTAQPAAPASPPPNAATLPSPTPLKPSAGAAPPASAPTDGSASMARQALVGQAERAATQGRNAADKAKEAADAGRAAAGEARIVAARAARPGLENAQRLSYPNGASYIGQTMSGQRDGLGVATLDTGERQSGEWKDDRLNGLGTVRLPDGSRYEGQWRDGQSTGLGVRERPGTERAEGNFVDGRLDGLAVRRLTGNGGGVQSGEWHGDQLDGLGVESLPNGERYEGEFKGSKRQGYGEVFGADGKGVPGRWEAGKQVESAP
ncbi:MORN repeat-containing protein [Enhydrobacter aerosaccus]|uniref:MORN repeat-containing protein n=1 Tax=Enhydrobacter aerosaccus TaxID=225324 RepID=A0A1T4QG19_9HYPH|nr:serine/threonine-protein kinase [Enhydrobacter aerosaccus]SKA02557.1 MORN repeat-containing protein [Enhydrobacter aerosaccus]